MLPMTGGVQSARRILLVEDNEMNRDMLRRRLCRQGFAVTTAVDGVEALEQARTMSPDVILMDLGLPRMDGWEASRQLKTDPETQAIPIVALTGHVLESHRRRAFEAGCDAFETKPVNLESLLECIARVLGA